MPDHELVRQLKAVCFELLGLVTPETADQCRLVERAGELLGVRAAPVEARPWTAEEILEREG